jgi:hypothetical protein
VPDQQRISPPYVHEAFVRGKCDYFVDVHLWPRQTRVDTNGWLSNFAGRETEFAVHLLNAFVYFSSEMTEQLFKASFQRLSSKVAPRNAPYVQAEAQWRHFQQNVLVTHVTGETPNDSDSGHIFARDARRHLGIPQTQIVSPDEALRILIQRGPRPVLFVDDFVGSGDQFIATWTREVELSDGAPSSFDEFSRVRGSSFFFCPLLCTSLGRATLLSRCRSLSLCPAHVLDERYSAFSSESLVWPDRLRQQGVGFLEAASERAGIPAGQRKGYRDLGLTLAFEHGVPDATLPLFYHDTNGWKPLVRRA